MATPRSIPRPVASGRPSADPACAGCGLLSAIRALRRAGVDVQGAVGCDGGAGEPPGAAPGRWATVTGLVDVDRRGAAGVLDGAWRAGAAFVLVADRLPAARSLGPEEDLRRAAARVVRLDPFDPAGAEARVREALDHPGTVLLTLAPCAREAPRSLPFRVDDALCNRCGGCVGLGCPALSDPGEEGMRVDADLCNGCGLCATLCRSRAIGPATPDRGGPA